MHRSNLYRRIYRHFLALLVFVGAITGGLLVAGWRPEYLRALAEPAARQLAVRVGERFDDPSARAELVQKIAHDEGIDVTVRDRDGTLLAWGGHQPFAGLASTDAEHLAHGGVVFSGGKTGFIAVPVIAQGRWVGVVQTPPVYHRVPSPSLWRPIVTVCLVLMLVARASAALAKRISLPIERLTEAARRLGEGDLAARVALPPWTWGHAWQRRRRLRRWKQGWHRKHSHGIDFMNDEIEQLTRAFNEMAERVERLVSGMAELLANVSHELRSPLARVRVALELLPREGADEARFADIENDLAELEQLIEAVLTTSRLGVAGLPHQLGPVDINAILCQLAERAQHDPVTAGKAVSVEVEPDLTVLADGVLLKRAVWNLIENAAKYGAPPIVVTAATRGGWLTIHVVDAGAGIPRGERERVFDPFYRADKARTPGRGGFGLGLTLARRVAEVHGGRIYAAPARVDADGEHGTRVVLELPLAPPG